MTTHIQTGQNNKNTIGSLMQIRFLKEIKDIKPTNLVKLFMSVALAICLVGCWQPHQQRNKLANQQSHSRSNSNNNHGQSTSHTVNPLQYHAFWLWGKPKNTTPLAQAQDIYVLQGHIYPNSPKVIRQGTGVLNFQKQKPLNNTMSTSNKNIWLVYRTDVLNWQNSTMQAINRRIQFWEKQGQRITGIQIDFDSATQKLADYGDFLKMVRAQLPSNYQLSITGLLDWTNQISTSGGAGLAHYISPSVDEIIIQTYQKTSTVADYQQYLKRLKHLTVPFKIGLIEDGKWDNHTEKNLSLSTNSYFKGYVVFLLNGES